MKKLSKKLLFEAFEELNALASEQSIVLELCIYGGVAMMLAYDSRAATKDVDAIIRPAEIGKKLVLRVAQKLGLHEDWLNDDVKQFVGFRERTRVLPELEKWKSLRLTVPVAGYLLAMKALACRDPLPGYEGDEQDLLFLIKKMEVTSVDQIQEVIDQYYADDALDARQIKRLKQLISKVHENKN